MINIRFFLFSSPEVLSATWFTLIKIPRVDMHRILLYIPDHIPAMNRGESVGSQWGRFSLTHLGSLSMYTRVSRRYVFVVKTFGALLSKQSIEWQVRSTLSEIRVSSDVAPLARLIRGNPYELCGVLAFMRCLRA